MATDSNAAIYDAIRKADAEGDSASVARLAQHLQEVHASAEEQAQIDANRADPTNAQPLRIDIRADTPEVRALNKAQTTGMGAPGYTDLITHGATLGLDDEASGVANAIGNVVASPFTGKFDPAGAYTTGRDSVRNRLDQARANTGWTGTAAELAGGLVGGAPRAATGAITSLLQAARTGAAGGAVLGGIGGYGSGNGTMDSLIRAGVGAGVGAGLGGALPIAAGVIAPRVAGLSRIVGRDTGGVARQVVGEALAQDSVTPAMAGQALTDASSRGTPLALADTGDNARALLASVSRRPGGARTVARDFVDTRQIEQGDRVMSAIGNNLGPVGNMRQASDDLLTQARTAAAPLYDQAYAVPGRTSEELQSLLATPAGRQALTRARSMAANERRDPNALGFDLDDQGEVVLTREPSTQTLDYVKRGLDDILEQSRDPITRQLNLDSAGRAVNQVRQGLVSEMDRLNPVYREARAAYAGPASAEEALQLGRKALNSSAEDIEAAISRMNPAEREQYALGFRGAMADNLGRSVDGADKAQRLLGTPRKRAALATVFGGEQNFNRFLQTMADERATTQTYRSVMTGSQTAERLAADAQTGDQGLADTVGGVALRGVSHPMGLLADAFQKLGEVGRFGAGRAGDETRESVAALLTETDPALLREIARAVRRAGTLQRVQGRTVNRISSRAGIGLGNVATAGGQAITRGN